MAPYYHHIKLLNSYKSCKLCPKNCGVDRLAGETGFCGETAVLRIGTALIHFGEEPPLVGTGGSGTIFVSGCNLCCCYCQNYQISQGAEEGSLGSAVTPQEFAGLCAALYEKGAENINIVTGSHAIPGIVEGVSAARNAGQKLTVLWNSSGYESTDALELLRGYADIFLPDLKTLDSKIAADFYNAPDYSETAAAAILKMIEMAGTREKVIVRHLVIPGYLDSTYSVLRWFADNARDGAQLSLMTQYTPIPDSLTSPKWLGKKSPMPNRYLTEEEYETVIQWLKELEIEDGFCQELVTGNEWLPDFKRPNPFSSELSVPVWHFKDRT